MYEPSKHIGAFFIAGFQYWEGPEAINQIKVGDRVELKLEMENVHDATAVMVTWRGRKLGYIPKDKNGIVALLTFYGYSHILEAKVLQVDPSAVPHKQVRVGMFVVDGRKGMPEASKATEAPLG